VTKGRPSTSTNARPSIGTNQAVTSTGWFSFSPSSLNRYLTSTLHNFTFRPRLVSETEVCVCVCVCVTENRMDNYRVCISFRFGTHVVTQAQHTDDQSPTHLCAPMEWPRTLGYDMGFSKFWGCVCVWWVGGRRGPKSGGGGSLTYDSLRPRHGGHAAGMRQRCGGDAFAKSAKP
jgi:hypothetical protein